MEDADSAAAAAAAAAALRRKRVLERGKDRLKSITVGGPKEEDLPSATATAAAIEPKGEASTATTATTTTATTTTAEAPLPPPPPPPTTTSTAARGAAAVLDRARTEIPPSPRGASRSKGGAAGGTASKTTTTATAEAAATQQQLLARRAAAATADDVALAALRASSPARLFAAAAAPVVLPALSRVLSGFAAGENAKSFQLLTPLATALAALAASRPLLVLLALQAWLLAATSALLASRPAALGAALEDAPAPAGPLRSLAKLAGFARGEEAARRLRWVAVAADALSAARDAAAVYLVSAVAVAYYSSLALAREMDSLVGSGGGGVGVGGGDVAAAGAAAAVEGSWS